MKNVAKILKSVFLAALIVQAGNTAMSINPRSELLLKKILAGSGENDGSNFRRSKKLSSSVPTHYPVILEIVDEARAETIIEELEAVVYHHRGTLYLTSIPRENLTNIPRLVGTDNFQLELEMEPFLDKARMVSGVDKAHAQLSTIESVTSNVERNTVTGICDGGFDPRHKAFRNCLVKWVLYDEYRGIRQEYDGYDKIIEEGPLTDDLETTHATHVGNIMAGFAGNSPYYGAAPASDFIVTTSELSQVGICSGIEDVIAYSKAAGKPAVVNISAGSYLGPHDGTDLVGRYLKALSEDAVICFSAGNGGAQAYCQSLDLDNVATHTGSAWCDMSWTGFNVFGGTDLWSSDNTPFEFRIILADVDKKTILYESDWMGGDGKDGEFKLNLEKTEWFATGAIEAEWGVSATNGRFNVAIEYDYSSEAVQVAGPWSRYVAGYNVRKVHPATHVDVYADGIYSFLHGFGIPGCVRGNSNGSISNLASTPGIISVGAWVSRASVPDVNDGQKDFAVNVNHIAPWSSWGTTVDGRKLPHFSAPGAMIVSAMSAPYAVMGDQSVAFEADGQKYYAELGTSMASPLAAGIFALWLDVDPDLDSSELLDIVAATANRNFEDIDDQRWGYGAIDAYSGLLEVIKRKDENSLPSVVDSDTMPTVLLRDGFVKVVWPGVENPVIKIFDLTGRQIANGHLAQGSLYIVEVVDQDTGRLQTYKIR